MRVLEATDGEEGLGLLDRSGKAIDLVVTDLMMSRVDGLQVTAVLARYRPELPVIVISGVAGITLREGAVDHRIRLLQKPFDVKQLIQSVQEALDSDSQLSRPEEKDEPAARVSLLDAAKALRTRAYGATWQPSGGVRGASPPSGPPSTRTGA